MFYRKIWRMSALLWIGLLLVAPVGLTLRAQDLPIGEAISTLNVRTGPGKKYASITQIPRKTQVAIEGRNQVGDWVVVHTLDNAARGWVATRYLILPDNFDLKTQPVLADTILQSDAVPTPSHIGFGDTLPSTGDLNQLQERLMSIPILPSVTSTTRNIFGKGQEKGNRRNVFTKVGDSITATQPFLFAYGQGGYNLGQYGYLQDTINFFGATSVNDKGENSFSAASIAAQSGFTAGGVLDAIWTDPSRCSTGESPLLCEYSLLKPSVAIILFGAVDMQISDEKTFEWYMQTIVQQTIDRGVIPVLNTFASTPNFRWESSLRFNTIIVNIAQKYDIPLINLWRATQPLPNYGVDTDQFHMSHDSGHIFTFDGSENQWGLTLRNLLTLQELDILRREVLLG